MQHEVFVFGPLMLRTGEDWDSQQHGNARSVTEINNHEIFRSPIDAISMTKAGGAHWFFYCVKLLKLIKCNAKTESHHSFDQLMTFECCIKCKTQA